MAIEAFEDYDTEDVQGILNDRLTKDKERLDNALETVKALCEPVEYPQDTTAYIRYFCGNADNKNDLSDTQQKRILLYSSVAALVRAYANLANEMREAGYTPLETEQIKEDIKRFENVRQEIKLASGDYIDLKVYEPAMRHLIDTYIRADDSEQISVFGDLTLVELIVERGRRQFIDYLQTSAKILPLLPKRSTIISVLSSLRNNQLIPNTLKKCLHF